MTSHRTNLIALVSIILFYGLLAILLFRPYFFRKQIPFPANLLVSVYSPFRGEQWEGFPNGAPFKPIGEDIVRFFYPYKKFSFDVLKQGKLPLWNPYVFSGNTHLATYQVALFYPLNFLFFLFGLVDGWSLLVIIQPLLSGLFTYLFLRSLNLSWRAGFLGSLTFTLSGWMVAQWEESVIVEHSILWLPLALYASELIWNTRKYRGFLLLTLALSCSILAGFMQLTIYLWMVVIAWNLFRYFEKNAPLGERKKRLLMIFLACSFSVAITAMQWLPALEAYLLSPRSSTAGKFIFEAFLMPVNHLATLVAPDFWGNSANYSYFYGRSTYHDKMIYLGIIPLVLVIYLYLQKTKAKIRFWKILGLVFFSLGFALPTSWIWYYLRVPMLSSFHPGRNFAVAGFIFSLLAAYGFAALEKQKAWRRWLQALSLPSLVLILLWFWVGLALLITRNYTQIESWCAKPYLTGVLKSYCPYFTGDQAWKLWLRYSTISFRNLILPSVFLAFAWLTILIIRKKPQLLFIYCFILICSSGLYFANKYLYFSERQFVYPELPVIQKLRQLAGINRVWGFGDAYFEPSVLSYYGLYSAEGYDAIYSRRYGELLSAISSHGQIAGSVARSDATLKAVREKDYLFTDNPTRERLMELLGVKYILEFKLKEDPAQEGLERLPEAKQLKIVWEDRRWRIWENQEALARAFLVDNYLVEPDGEKAVAEMFDPKTDLGRTVILEEDPGLSSSKLSETVQSNPSPGSVEILTYEPELINIKVKTDKPRLLFLSDNYFPGWIATVDREPTKIYLADYSFRLVAVPGGEHEISFIYRPDMVKLGLIISSLGLLSSLSYYYWRLYLRRDRG